MRRLIGALAVSALALGACTSATSAEAPSAGQSAGAGSSSAPASALASPSASAAAVDLGTPIVGECWDYPDSNFWVLEANPDATPVDCEEPHTAQVVWVGSVADDLAENPFTTMATLGDPYRAATGRVDWDKVPADVRGKIDAQSERVDPAFEACRDAILDVTGARAVGGMTQTTLFRPDVTGPSDEQWAAGARWVRCLVNATLPENGSAKPRPLMELPATLDGVLNRSSGTKYRYCWRFPKNSDEAVYAECGSSKARNMWLTVTSKLPQPANIRFVSKGQAESMARSVCLTALSKLLTRRTTAEIANVMNVWGYTEMKDGEIRKGFFRKSWGKPNAFIGCAVPSRGFSASVPVA